MHRKRLNVFLGDVSVYYNGCTSNNTPIVFLHGLYLDSHLWEQQMHQLNDRMCIAIDMPLHGQSREISKYTWTLSDCSKMLIEVMDAFSIKRAIVVGHSWGAMTAVLAASNYPDRFLGLGLCNMPFKPVSKWDRLSIKLKHIGLMNRSYYFKKVTKTLIADVSIHEMPAIESYFKSSISRLANRDIRYVDRLVRMYPPNLEPIIKNLQVNTIALIGILDYVGRPPVDTILYANGAHISPIEDPRETNHLIQLLIKSCATSTLDS